MGTRPSSWVAATLIGLSLIATAHADPKGDIKAKTKEAMENYDLLEFDAAKKLLDQALAIAKKGKLDKDPLTATIYLDIGITAHAAGDVDGAKAAFGAAVGIDAKIQIPAAYKSPELTKLLDEARASAKPSGGGAVEPPPDGGATDAIDCEAVKGLQHTIIDTAPAGASLAIEALVGSDVSPTKVSVLYRVEGATDFTEVKMKKEGDCKYKGAIPASAMKGSLLHYYVGAFNDVNKPVAAKGSSGAPNLIEIAGVAVGKTDGEDPIGGGKTDGPTDGVVGGVIAGGKQPRVMFTIFGGTGAAFLSGTTEGGFMVTDQGFKSWGNSLLVITPELSYMVTRQLAVGIAARIGLPLGANVNAEDAEGHSSVAPGALLRLRYALSPSGEGVRVMGQVGGGVMRSTLSVTTDNNMAGTDIVGQGPLLLGGGIGYFKYLSGTFAFVADVSALVGIAVTDKVGTTKVNSGFGADFSLGFALGF